MSKFVRLAFLEGQDILPTACFMHEAGRLLGRGVLDNKQHEDFLHCVEWFGDHMMGDEFLEISRRPDTHVWFKLLPLEHIYFMSRMRSIFEQNGYRFDFFQCEDPGVVLFENDYIVVSTTPKVAALDKKTKSRQADLVS